MATPRLSDASMLAVRPPSEDAPRLRPGTPAYLKGRKGVLLVTAALGIIGLIAGWRWFGATAMLPLLYTLPCAAMMAMCMRGHGGSGNAPTKPNGSTESGPDISQ